MLKEHPAYQEEMARLDMTLEEVVRTLEEYDQTKIKLKKEVDDNLREFQHDPNEGSQLYIELMTGMELLKFYDEKLGGLERARQKPYFARIDFTPNDKDEVEKCYIGKSGLTRDSDNYPLIIDWRAPIATLYYEGRLGECSYVAPFRGIEELTIEGDLSLKRQFTIEKGRLQDIFDIDITTNDPLLQQALGASADNRLKDIASTIQAEQNRIIRANMKRPLIVQGVAGSGKTTIALHRIAYLIYTYEKYFDPDSFMIIAPNRLFLNYISEVLPELGVESVLQTTFIDFMLDRLGKNFKLKLHNPNDKLTQLVDHKTEENTKKQQLLMRAAKFKGSLLFKEAIDKYVKDIEENLISRKDLSFKNKTIIPSSVIRNIFLAEYKYYPVYRRINKLEGRLKKMVKKRVAELIKEEQERVDRVVEKYFLKSTPSDEERERALKLFEKRDQLIKGLERAERKLVPQYIKKIKRSGLIHHYLDLVCDPDTLDLYTGGELSDELLEFIAQHTREMIESGKIEFEDLASLVYLKFRLFGTKRFELGHVVIDEAQDLSLFQYYLIKLLTRTESFTIMGDLSQGIHSYRAIDDWDQVMEGIFPKADPNYTVLEKSYRTTIEIMHVANEIIKHHKLSETSLAEPIIRHGQLPQFFLQQDPDEVIDFIMQKKANVSANEVHSAAIICKTMKECKKLHTLFPKDHRPQLITEDITEYTSGWMILPSYLAKGLEFDWVFIVTIDEEYTEDDLDIKLLYIAMTRALHNLYLCSANDLSPMLANVDPTLYGSVEAIGSASA